MPPQLLTWKATSQAASALAEVEAEGPGVAGVVAVAALEVKEVVAGVGEVAAEVTAGVGRAGLGRSVKAKAVARGQGKPAEQQPGAKQMVPELLFLYSRWACAANLLVVADGMSSIPSVCVPDIADQPNLQAFAVCPNESKMLRVLYRPQF